MPTSTEALIAPIIFGTYGKGNMSRALVAHLADKVDAWSEVTPSSRTREDMIRLTCWDWFSGGSTAESVARKIEAALNGVVA